MYYSAGSAVVEDAATFLHIRLEQVYSLKAAVTMLAASSTHDIHITFLQMNASLHERGGWDHVVL